MKECKRFSRLGVAIFIGILSGCATFEPSLRPENLNRPRLATVKSSQRGLEVALEEFVTPTKSMEAFDAVVASYGVLPLLVRVENSGTTNYRLPRGQIKASLGEDELALLDARDAATQGAARGYAGNALGWTLATGPFALLIAPLTLTASSAHTASVNKKIEEQFGTLELADALIRSKQTAAGFVYFKLPPATWQLDTLLVEVRPVDDESGEQLVYKFTLPRMEIPVPREMQPRKSQDD